MNKKLGIVAVVAAWVVALPVVAQASHKAFVSESIQVADHFMFVPDADPIIVPGATILIRDFKADIVTATVTSSALVPNDAYSIWWVVFNRPWKCMTPWACGSGDLSNPATKSSVFWGGGILASSEGYGTTQLQMRPGRTNRELFGPLRTDTGLQNIRKAEIHVVLRTHGPVGMAGTVAQQLGTVGEACPLPDCANKYFSVHRVK